MENLEAIFVGVWNEKWSKVSPPKQVTAGGTLRRINVGALLGKTMPPDAAEGAKLVKGIFDDLDTTLGERAVYWSPAPGLIDLYYPKLLPDAADLSLSVVVAAIGRRIHDEISSTAQARTETAPPSERRVSFEEFQKICLKAKASFDQIQMIDISEIMLGKSDAQFHLSKRAWQLVDRILDDYMVRGGYSAHHGRNQILLFFPGRSVGFAKLKRKAIINAIELHATVFKERGEGGADTGADGRTDEGGGKSREHRDPDGMDPKEIAQLNEAIAALAAKYERMSVTAADLAMPPDVQPRLGPIWRANSRSLVGYMVDAERTGPAQLVVEGELDLPLLAYAMEKLIGQLEENSPYLTMVALHWKSLERTPTRVKILEYLATAPEEMRRFIIPILTGIPSDLLPSRVDERVRELRQLHRAVGCRVDLGRRDFSQLKGLGFHSIGVSLPVPEMSETEVIAAMDPLLDAIGPLKAKSFIGGLNSRSLMIAALASGFDYLSGQVITTNEAVGGIQEFSVRDIYAPQV